MVNRGASNEVEVKEAAQSTNSNGFNVVARKPKKAATGGSDGADVQVTNVPAEYGDADLLKRHHLFGRYGRVVKINIAQGSAKGKVNVTVTYSTSSEAGLAAHCVDGAYLSGQALSAKSSSPSPTTERSIRPSSHDVKHLPQLPKSLQPQPAATSSTTETVATKHSEGRKETQPKAVEAAKNQQSTTQTQKPVAAALAPGVSAWSKPLTVSVKGATSNSSVTGSATTGAATASTTTSAAPATQNVDKTATKAATPVATPAAKLQTTKQQANSATTAATIVRGNARASPKTQAANGAANVSLPAALRNLGHPEVAFGGDEADEAPKINVLDQPTTSGPFTGKFGAPDANDNKLFDDQAHVNSVLSDSGAIDNTPPRPTEVNHPAYDTITAPRTAPQSYVGAANGNVGQRNQQRGRQGSSHRSGGRRGAPGGSPALSGQPIVNVPPAIPPVGGPSPPHFNMGRTKLNPEAPEFYPAAARQPVLPLNPGQYGGMYDPQYPSFPPGGPGQPVPWGYPPARGAPFGAGPRGYYGGPYGYQ